MWGVNGGPSTAFRWTAETGCVVVGLAGDDRTATGVSADGSTVCGWQGTIQFLNSAFVWTQAGGARQLPWHPDTPNPAFAEARAWAISGDSHTIIGRSDGPRGDEAIKWVDEVPQRLPAPAGWFAIGASSINYDGSVIVGGMLPETGPFDRSVTFISTPELGVLEAAAYFAHYGWQVPEEALFEITCVSGDGLSFGGSYTDPTVSPLAQGFVFTVPGPGPLALGAAVLCLAPARRRRG